MSALAVCSFPVGWIRSPRRPDHLRGLTNLDHRIWQCINWAIQTRRGLISVPEIAYHCECTERAVYKSLVRLFGAGAIERETPRPGLQTVYRLPFAYAGGTAKQNSTPERQFRTPLNGDSVPHKQNAHARKVEKPLETEATADARDSVAALPDEGKIAAMPDPAAVKPLTDRGIEKPKAIKLARENTPEWTRPNIALYDDQLRRGADIKPGWLIAAIERGFAQSRARARERLFSKKFNAVPCRGCGGEFGARGAMDGFHFECHPDAVKA